MEIKKNILLTGFACKPVAADIFYTDDAQPKPLVIYAHGFNGFKDWANFDLIAKQFAEAGFMFIKFNTSHNGTTPEHPEEFVDLEAYGQNNYTKELYDLQQVIGWAIDEKNPHAKNIDPEKLYLLGHSRGGGQVILTAAKDDRVKAITTWASVADAKTPWGGWSEEKMNEWKQTGVQYYLNGRTNQQMPLYYQLYEDYMNNAERLDIKKAISSLHIPVLICHGNQDPAVPVEKARLLHEAYPSAEVFLIDSDHVFGRKHPWTAVHLPEAMQEVVDRTISFYKSINA